MSSTVIRIYACNANVNSYGVNSGLIKFLIRVCSVVANRCVSGVTISRGSIQIAELGVRT